MSARDSTHEQQGSDGRISSPSAFQQFYEELKQHDNHPEMLPDEDELDFVNRIFHWALSGENSVVCAKAHNLSIDLVKRQAIEQADREESGSPNMDGELPNISSLRRRIPTKENAGSPKETKRSGLYLLCPHCCSHTAFETRLELERIIEEFGDEDMREAAGVLSNCFRVDLAQPVHDLVGLAGAMDTMQGPSASETRVVQPGLGLLSDALTKVCNRVLGDGCVYFYIEGKFAKHNFKHTCADYNIMTSEDFWLNSLFADGLAFLRKLPFMAIEAKGVLWRLMHCIPQGCDFGTGICAVLKTLGVDRPFAFVVCLNGEALLFWMVHILPPFQPVWTPLSPRFDLQDPGDVREVVKWFAALTIYFREKISNEIDIDNMSVAIKVSNPCFECHAEGLFHKAISYATVTHLDAVFLRMQRHGFDHTVYPQGFIDQTDCILADNLLYQSDNSPANAVAFYPDYPHLYTAGWFLGIPSTDGEQEEFLPFELLFIALVRLHACGVIHLDLYPTNIVFVRSQPADRDDQVDDAPTKVDGTAKPARDCDEIGTPKQVSLHGVTPGERRGKQKRGQKSPFSHGGGHEETTPPGRPRTKLKKSLFGGKAYGGEKPYDKCLLIDFDDSVFTLIDIDSNHPRHRGIRCHCDQPVVKWIYHPSLRDGGGAVTPSRAFDWWSLSGLFLNRRNNCVRTDSWDAWPEDHHFWSSQQDALRGKLHNLERSLLELSFPDIKFEEACGKLRTLLSSFSCHSPVAQSTH